MSNKTVCNITRSQFNTSAQPLQATFGNNQVLVGVKEFSTGSFGWYTSGKAQVIVDGKPCQVQLAITATVIGSKDSPR